MNRRDFLHTAGAVGSVLGFASVRACPFCSECPWRTFEVTTELEVLKPSGATRLWVPAALLTSDALSEDAGKHHPL